MLSGGGPRMGREEFESEVDGRGRGRGHERPYLGQGLFAGGVGLVLVAVALGASMGIAGALGLGTTGARELAGGIAGIGLAAALVGALAIVPVDRGTWYRGVGGALVACVGVAGFLWAFPGRWYGDSPDMAFSVLAVYALGVITVGSYLFAGVSDLAGRVGRTKASAAPGGNEADATGAPEEGANGTTVTNGTNGIDGSVDRDGGEVLYERTADAGGDVTGATSTATAADGAEPSGAATIDRIESTEGEFTWSDSEFTVEPIDRIEASESSAETPESPGPAEHTSNGDRARASGDEAKRHRTPVAVTSDGAGTLTTPTNGHRPSASGGSTRSRSRSTTGSAGTGSVASRGSDASASSGREDASPDGGGNEGNGNGIDAVRLGPSVDEYCGNCAFFQYRRADGELTPYCGYHEEAMDDMEPCLGWRSNS